MDGGYSKDFLQSPAAQWPTIDSVLGTPTATDFIPLEYRWPGGKRVGHWQKSAVAGDTRGQLKWVTSEGAPIPWKVGDNSTNPAATIPGDPSKTSAAAADAEFDALEAKNLDPWIVAIKLQDESNILHARAYLGNPPNALKGRGIDTLPEQLRDAIRGLPNNTAGGAVVFPVGMNVRAPELVARILTAFEDEPNVLLIGPPGTGKTVALEDIREMFEAGNSAVMFDPDKWEQSWTTSVLPPATSRKSLSLVFHPSYAYEDFVAGLVPQSTATGLKLVARPGPLLSLAHWANEPGRHALLVIDEFNRGPAAAIFGDTLALLDAQKRCDSNNPISGAKIQRPFPTEAMEVEPSFAKVDGSRTPAVDLKLPKQLWILAALNSTDRSVAPLDAALRRRFVILQVPPDYLALAKHLRITLPEAQDGFSPSVENPENWTEDDVRRLAFFVLRALNERIGLVLGQDFLLGHALLWSVHGNSKDMLARTLGRAFDQRISATLRLTFVDQDEPLAAILKIGSPPTDKTTQEPKDAWIARWNSPPPELQEVATPRLEIREIGGLSSIDILKSLRALL
jgi:5-methylcytosine-specific restriction protein B